MTPNKVIEIVDGIKPNVYDEETKFRWINELEGIVKRKVIQEDNGERREWKEQFLDDKWQYNCPFCGYEFVTYEKANNLPNYCQDCGVKMDGGIEFKPLEYPKDTNTELIVPAPYDNVYGLYIEAMIDYYNKEIANYNNSVAMFDARFMEYKKDYIRHHQAKG